MGNTSGGAADIDQDLAEARRDKWDDGENSEDERDPSMSPTSRKKLSPCERRQRDINIALRNLMSDQHSVRQQALKTLGEAGVQAAAYHEEVAALLDDPHFLVRIWAVQCLGKFGVRAGSHAPRVMACIQFQQEGGSPRSPKDPQKDGLRKAAIETMGKLGERGADEAVKLIAPEQPYDMRRQGTKMLAQQGASAFKYRKELVLLLYDKAEDIRVGAAEALGRLGTGIGPDIIPLLTHDAWRTRKVALQTLGFIGKASREFIPHIAKRLTDEHKDVRAAACETFSNIGPDADPLGDKIALLQDDPQEVVRLAAKDALNMIGRNDVRRD